MYFIGEDLSAVGCADLGPNIVGQLIPDNIRLSRGSSISWDCFATGTAPTYQWSKDFQVKPEKMLSLLEKIDFPNFSGQVIIIKMLI